ncbi:prepilin-type N-terminal cleavage/methylation domain-containing protein [Pelotalea chapellei]|uniref:Prepilin-type N-terminal cleavage/methylation domain-containing protein n=1 Tax=Pelotalea chapellei TaxID=44671 RepID=A0ABS5U6Z7_9BACT|nr:prepilin-type N-terminal cleavage/methylation domain-containing protein [Pelotalea chapellei]MBT1071439.1 prepilin-type N-terminal cleavage/methylation domain-containing protein [Pelotalea chapellei]
MLKILTMRKGVTLVELVVTVTILTVLASVVMPLAQMTSRRTKELELKRNLRIIRTALDDFKKSYDKAIDEKKILPSMNKSGLPETLNVLVEGYDFGGMYPVKKKFLRRIPVDPFNPPRGKEEPKWGLRSYNDKPDSTSWGGEDVYDVYSLNEGTAIDGTKYKEW